MKTSRILLLAGLFAVAISCGQKKEKKQPEPTMSSTSVEAVQPDNTANPVKVVYHVEGMTCDDCENSIKESVTELKGVTMVEANFEDSTATVMFVPSKTDEKQIIAAIEKRGYQVKK